MDTSAHVVYPKCVKGSKRLRPPLDVGSAQTAAELRSSATLSVGIAWILSINPTLRVWVDGILRKAWYFKLPWGGSLFDRQDAARQQACHPAMVATRLALATNSPLKK